VVLVEQVKNLATKKDGKPWQPLMRGLTVT